MAVVFAPYKPVRKAIVWPDVLTFTDHVLVGGVVIFVERLSGESVTTDFDQAAVFCFAGVSVG